jgi:hypothetical protein
MRAIGPQSVSSFLKVALDVVYAALCLGAAIVGPLALAVLIYMPFSSNGLSVVIDHRLFASPLAPGPMAAVLAGLEAYLACLIVILHRIRQIMETLTVGDPFRPENVGRLRQVGMALVALEIASYALRAILAWAAPGARISQSSGGWLNPTVWFAVLVVFVLAEVFREGARLRREAELTI